MAISPAARLQRHDGTHGSRCAVRPRGDGTGKPTGEHQAPGLAAAKARGVKLGKRPKLFAKEIQPMLDGGLTVAQVAKQLGKSRQAIYSAIARG